jgi:hypothetical protein
MQCSAAERRDAFLVKQNKDKKKPEQIDRTVLFKCEKCILDFEDSECFSDHKREKHRIFECDSCDFSCSSNISLKVHKAKTHSNLTEAQIASAADNRKRIEEEVRRRRTSKT